MTHPDPTPLSYGRRAPVHRRRWFVLLACLTLFGGACLASWAGWRHVGEPWARERARLREVAREKARVQALKQQWMTYREPADRAVFVEPADLSGRLQQAGNYYATGAGPIANLPACRKAWPFGPAGGGLGFAGAQHGLRARDGEEAVLFLHHRKTPAGHNRVVLLDVRGIERKLASGRPNGRFLWLCATIVDLNAWSGVPLPVNVNPMFAPPPDPAIRGGTIWTFPPDWERFQKPMRLFAGQPDPDDLTHFTIGYEYDGRRGTIDGYLQDAGRDGEEIRFVVRDVPVAAATLPRTDP